jgi:hypothetical protein
MPKSPRHDRAAKKAGKPAPEIKAYVITDPHHRPDLRGEFAGAKVRKMGMQQVVDLTDKAAKYYLDAGAIKPLLPPDAPEPPAPEPEKVA